MNILADNIRASVGNERYRFLQLATGVWGATLVSATYAFGLIAHHIKDEFNLSQEQLTTISTVAATAGFFCIPAGAAFDKWGPRVVDIVGTILSMIGFTIYGLLFSGVVPYHMATILVAAVLTAWPTGFFDIGTLMPNLFTFPLDRGSIVMLQKTFMGLGSAFLSIIYVSFFHNDVQHYCFFVVGLTACFGFGSALFANVPAYERLKEETDSAHAVVKPVDDIDIHILNVRANKKRLMFGFVLLWISLVFFMGVSILNAESSMPQGVSILLGVLAVVIMISFLLMGLLPDSYLGDGHHSGEESGLLQQQDEDDAAEEGAKEQLTHLQNMNSFFQNLRGIDLWLLWWVAFSVWGSNVIVIYNVAQVYRAANDNHYNAKVNSMYVALIGIGSALGRIVAGNLEQRLLKKHIPVTILFPVPAAMTAVAFVLFLVLPAGGIVVPFMLGSFGFGVSWAVIVLSMRLMHGKDVGKNYNFLFTGPMTAALVFNRPMFGYFYDRIGREQGNYPNCAGKECYRNTFLLFLGLNVLAIGAGLLAHRRWMKNYFTKKHADGEQEAS